MPQGYGHSTRNGMSLLPREQRGLTEGHGSASAKKLCGKRQTFGSPLKTAASAMFVTSGEFGFVVPVPSFDCCAWLLRGPTANRASSSTATTGSGCGLRIKGNARLALAMWCRLQASGGALPAPRQCWCCVNSRQAAQHPYNYSYTTYTSTTTR